jgi:hypothetical protein
MRINRDVDPARCLSCAQGRHLNCTGTKDWNTDRINRAAEVPPTIVRVSAASRRP